MTTRDTSTTPDQDPSATDEERATNPAAPSESSPTSGDCGRDDGSGNSRNDTDRARSPRASSEDDREASPSDERASTSGAKASDRSGSDQSGKGTGEGEGEGEGEAERGPDTTEDRDEAGSDPSQNRNKQ
ncbi:MAG: hypothetical protein ACOC0P_03600, partial [Planctomycetota bacterium]